ncbi:MAG: dihydrolipoyl dehydrogenase [bacterium]|uniref:Dihydrolipoyl dehydrogenase n=1 Tax=Candidatus Infernicultor aquiphilus TaxID=1805029 RepID=A0A1J5GA47_9BACT|nr:dihydrolipoyl dehydrogenase [bacterium]OIP69164.1 MAG: dihydrolipoyl dehydrogenase [Candidatus Atribacteria bacterium CG2_30_33_13]PIU25848.1 MAG: dihydrolipoyl dehydrogenase [Candidatus Atribacteria bacterium CG08_land_8_20_14_0_20_33_29]PIW12526.1 MAG: dihydrolipoyl dehydrogenase [Candidatus Atribacteria bacterium CG17_big_fil_post_rev_8_21_14_2_50_34_11]PIX33717.1 MAG: dihydrolipoyl dehydrogenase [Candidatus Atribacteria bacterium CG_4_8_14_3_um_filter_34_18]PJB57552.1 MAG: dihydrolipoyl
MNEIDVAIIGGGPGGYVAAIKAAHLGLKAVLIEKDKLGGVCLNRGCIPTKALVGTAELLNQLQRAKEFGIQVKEYSYDFPAIMKRKEMIAKRMSSGVGQLMKANQIRVIQGEGNILEPGVVEVINIEGKKELIKTENIIIATGSSVMKIPIPGLENEGVIDSDGALSLSELPTKMIIIGGGVIGIEFAGIFKAMGVEVTVVEMLPRILLPIDEEIANRLAFILKRQGIKILTNSKVEGIEKTNQNFKVLISNPEGKQRLETEKVLLAAGRVPDFGNINVQKLGIELEGRAIKVDQKMRTNIPGIYAVGDVVGKIMLAHVASREGIVAVENISGKEVLMDYKVVPNCVFSLPEVASVGLTEEEARKKYDQIKVSKFPYLANGKALGMGETEGMVKIIADSDTSELLGLHILGAHASDLIAEGTLALSMEATAEEIVNTIHAHPTLAETIAEAAEGIIGKPIHLTR